MYKKFNVAIEALAYISLHSGENAVSSKDICTKLGLKLRYIEQIMQKLVRHGVLKGMRGAGGGYFINKDRRKISLAEIYNIISEFETGESNVMANEFSVLASEINEEIREETLKILSKITLEEIYNRVKKISKTNGKNPKTDFVI